MKKLFLLLAVVGLMMTACAEGGGLEENNDNPTEQPSGGNEDDNTEKPVFEIDAEGSYTIPAEGAVIEVTVTTNLEYRVEVSEDAKAWLSIGNTRAVRTETLVFTVAKNESDRERTATITIFNKDDEKVFEFRLTQEFNDKEEIPENIFFATDKENISISPDGGSAEIVVYSNYKWEVSGTSDWCTPSVKNGEANEDGQKLTFSADVAYDDREATFWLRCADEKIKITVTQAFKETIIPDENNTFNIPAEGGIATIAYQTTIDCEVIIPEEAKEWITIAPATRGLVSESINLNVAENTTYSARTAVVKVVAKDNANLVVEYTINQEQNDDILVDGDNVFNLGYRGNSITIKHQTNVDCEVIIPTDAQEWITIAPKTRGLETYSTTLNISANNSDAQRSAVVKVVAKNNSELFVEYTINQNQKFVIEYTSSDGNIVTPYKTNAFGATIFSNTYENGVGIIEFDSPITSIGDNAFNGCTSLTSITIPNSVTSIGESAFNWCSKITSVTIPNSVTSIGKYAFYNCSKLTSVIIGESVTSIGDNAFQGCTSLTSVTIPNSVTEIGQAAFNGCSSLTSVTIPNSVTKIESTAFAFCSSLTSVTIPNSVTEIGGYAFKDCSRLKSVTIPNSVTTIGERAFSGCTGELLINSKIIETNYTSSNCPQENGWLCDSKFTKLTIGDNVTKIGNYAFSDCSCPVTSTLTITIPNSVTTIGERAFSGCSFVRVTIPNSVTSIGNSAFSGCYSVGVTIPNSVTSFGENIFYGCSGALVIDNKIIETDYTLSNLPQENGWLRNSKFTNLTIGDNVTKIGSNAFKGCSSLGSVTIGNGVTEIGSSAFSGCSSLESVTIGNSVTKIGRSAFYDCNKLTSVYISDLSIWCKIDFESYQSNPLYYGAKLYLNKKEITEELSIPEGTTSIGGYAFYGCSKITSVTIPNSVTKIGSCAFKGCSSLKSATIGESVTSIGDDAFYNCSSLTSVIIGESVTSIGNSAFENCTSLTSVTIPNSVTSIGKYAFYNCSKLTSVIIGESVTSIGERAFYNCSKLTSVTIPNSVTSIGKYAFYDCSKLTSVIIGESVTKIGDHTFCGCSSLTSVTIPNSVTSIGVYAFSSCSSLTSATIGNGVTSIGNRAFSYCSSLTRVTIGNGVTEIGMDAFYDCSSLSQGVVNISDIAAWCNIVFAGSSSNPLSYAGCLLLNNKKVTYLTIPDGVTSIGNYAFQCCWSITRVTIPNGVTSIGNSAFSVCESLTSVTIPESVTKIGNRAFFNCDQLDNVYCKATTPPSLGEHAFHLYVNGKYGTSSDLDILVPSGLSFAYKNASGWSDYKGHIYGYDFE